MKTLFTTAMSAILLVNNVWSIDQTTTGCYYPMGTSDLGNYAGWLASGCGTSQDYFAGEYHIGHDFSANAGDPVYPITSGVIVYISYNGWGSGNVGVFVRHGTSNGVQFLALYGHIRTTLIVGDLVIVGSPFATVGSWSYGDHLHFGVIPTATIPPSPFGRMECVNWPSANSFVDPINWIVSNTPMPLGILANGSANEEIIVAYFRHGGSSVLGSPHDNGGTKYVHNWNGVTIQDLKEDSNDFVLAYNPSLDKAFLLQHGFRLYYLTHNGPGTLGRPWSEEYQWVDKGGQVGPANLEYTRQNFSGSNGDKMLLWRQGMEVTAYDAVIDSGGGDLEIALTPAFTAYALSDTQAFVSAGPISGGVTYRVLRDGNPVGILNASYNFTDSGLSPGTSYSYELVVVNGSRNTQFSNLDT